MARLLRACKCMHPRDERVVWLVWSGVAWCGLVWSGVVWCGLVCCSRLSVLGNTLSWPQHNALGLQPSARIARTGFSWLQ